MRTCLLFFSICLVMQTNAQEFPLKSAKWYYTNNGGHAAANTYLWTVQYEKDTIINGDLARVLRAGPNPAYGLDEEYIFKYSNDSVYALTRSGKWGLLYVFSANVGDTMVITDFYVSPEASHPFVVDSILTEVYGSTNLKHFYTHCTEVPGLNFCERSYTERIGENFFYPIMTGSIIPEHAEIRCYVDSSVTAQLNYTGPCNQGNPYAVQEISTEPIFDLYPSLTGGTIYIRSNSNENFSISVFDCLGNLVINESFGNQDESSLTIPLSAENGLYVVRIDAQTGRSTQKIILYR